MQNAIEKATNIVKIKIIIPIQKYIDTVSGKARKELQEALVSFDNNPELLKRSYADRLFGEGDIFVDLGGLDPVEVFLALQKNVASLAGKNSEPIVDSYKKAKQFLQTAQIKNGYAGLWIGTYDGKEIYARFEGSVEHPHRLCVLRNNFLYNIYNDPNGRNQNDPRQGLCQRVIDGIIAEQKAFVQPAQNQQNIVAMSFVSS